MIRFPRLVFRVALLALAAVTISLAACGGGVKDQAAQARMAQHFDMVVKAYKNGQFLLDGAVLSPADLGGHFSYLHDQHKLPKRVLLERSDDTSIHKKQVQAMAYIQAVYGVASYYDDDGVLRRIKVTNAKDLKPLLDAQHGAPLPDENRNESAAGTSHFPGGG